MSLITRQLMFPRLGEVELSDVVVSPDLALDEVLIRSEVSLISAGTEIARLLGQEGGNFPFVPGYATIGRIEAVGPGTVGATIGQRVFFAGKHAGLQRFRINQDHQWGRCYAVPDGIPAEDAVFVCLAQIALTAPWTVAAGMGESVAVFGLGAIGNLCAQLYQLDGADVLALDPQGERCNVAWSCGIRNVSSVPAGEQAQAVRRWTGDAGATVCVDAVGHSAVTMTAVDSTRLMGSAVILGTPRTPMTGDLTLLLNRLHMQGISLHGAHMWRFPAMRVRGTTRTVEDAYAMLLAMIGDGRLRIAPLRTHVIPPEQAPAMYQTLRAAPGRAVGVVIDWRAG